MTSINHLILVGKLVLPGRTLAPAIPHLMLLPLRGQNAIREKSVKEVRSNLRYVESPAPRLCRIGVGFNIRERGDQVVQVLLGHPLELLRILVTIRPPGIDDYCDTDQYIRRLQGSGFSLFTCQEVQCSMVILTRVWPASSLFLLLLDLLFFAAGSELLLPAPVTWDARSENLFDPRPRETCPSSPPFFPLPLFRVPAISSSARALRSFSRCLSSRAF